MIEKEPKSGTEISSENERPQAEKVVARDRYQGFLHDSYLGDGSLLGLAEANLQKQALRYFDESEPSVLA